MEPASSAVAEPNLGNETQLFVPDLGEIPRDFTPKR
jgi:hypothetical protein